MRAVNLILIIHNTSSNCLVDESQSGNIFATFDISYRQTYDFII